MTSSRASTAWVISSCGTRELYHVEIDSFSVGMVSIEPGTGH